MSSTLKAHRKVGVLESLLAAARKRDARARAHDDVRAVKVIDIAQVDLVAAVALKKTAFCSKRCSTLRNDSSASISRPSRRWKTTCLLRASAYSMSDRRRAW